MDDENEELRSHFLHEHVNIWFDIEESPIEAYIEDIDIEFEEYMYLMRFSNKEPIWIKSDDIHGIQIRKKQTKKKPLVSIK